MYEIGFTGTRAGMTEEQKKVFRDMLILASVFTEASVRLHHGGCVGADEDAHHIAKEMGAKIVVHAPINKMGVFDYSDADEIRDSKEYLERNHDIVDESMFLAAAPKTKEEVLRSGTWATIRYARKQNKMIRML